MTTKLILFKGKAKRMKLNGWIGCWIKILKFAYDSPSRLVFQEVIVRTIYKVIRSILFSVTLFVVGIYVIAYVLLSIPFFTNIVKTKVSSELSTLLGGNVEIGNINFYPFNELTIEDLEVFDPQGEKILDVATIGAGISLWKLIFEGGIELNYAEIIGLDATIIQREENGPLNIQFLIDALSSKDENKEKKAFELSLRNVVLRKSSAQFLRPWLLNKKIGEIDLGDLRIANLAADVAFPRITEKEIEMDLRRLSFLIPGITQIEKIGLKGKFGKAGLDIKNLVVEFPSSRIFLPQVNIKTDGNESMKDVLRDRIHVLEITNSYITPSDFSFLYTPLELFPEALSLNINAEGNLNYVKIEDFNFGTQDLLTLAFNGKINGLNDLKNMEGNLSGLDLFVSSLFIGRLASDKNIMPTSIGKMLSEIGNLSLTGNFEGKGYGEYLKGNIEIHSDAFKIQGEAELQKSLNNSLKMSGELSLGDVKLHKLIPSQPLDNINATLLGDITVSEGHIEGMSSIVLENFEMKGKRFDGFSMNINKEGDLISGDFLAQNYIAEVEAKFESELEGENKRGILDMDIQKLNLSELIEMKGYQDYLIKGTVNLAAEGSGINNLTGDLALNKFSFVSPDNKKQLKLNELIVTAVVEDSLRNINLKSDWVDAQIDGTFHIKELPLQLKQLASSVFPALIQDDLRERDSFTSDLNYEIYIKNNNSLTEFFNLPVRMLVPVTIDGSIYESSNSAGFTLNVPYLQQGKDKLIYDTKIIASIDGNTGVLDAMIETNLPVKRGDLSLKINLYGKNNELTTDIHWKNTENSDFRGHIAFDTSFGRNHLTMNPEINVELKPTILQMGSADWNISRSNISYTDKFVTVKNLKIWHDDQFVDIEGVASGEYSDILRIKLADIDVEYVFDMLQINYVTFGGYATGEIAGHALLSSDPVAETESFSISDFSYNGCKLGSCVVSSRWNNEEKEVEIMADISSGGVRTVYGSGGIWLGRDSLCFDIAADKVAVDFIQPFMSVFSSHVGGYATGEVKLFGNFHDIDMTGKIFADSVAVQLDYTNTVYHGSDTVFLNPGQIAIPNFRLYDKYGNSALLSGEVTHRYFHDASFNFRLTEAQNFLCYDTNSDLNPDWYGTLFGTGSAYLRGEPGIADISADMTVSGNSAFTFVLNDTQYARDYQFLTFSDRRKEEEPKTEFTVNDFKEMLRKKMKGDELSLSRFGIDIRASVTPQALFTLVMDPAAGDKITARGHGALQVKYETDNDEMMMYGKYEIDEGNYNFSLQDIILRDFKIKEGSFISFNGNPLAADLDISATYRVNTNLSDLDKSFATDRDLNRTNVPVDALLSVTGNMQHPDITFDIELPTLTQDVERKVKSIISTDDMMNRQIIYLLALNRFYTPEYMGSSGNGSEWAAVASSTISSQLSNILGQLTDKFSVSPSFRSDKGDFSDIEVDVALSSRLLNNRLLVNGNFGYRDRSNSSTTFVGDFDVEYLLSKNGNLRLKAYNHFNDQNYYLREALTTQGLGVVYRRDFDNWFTFLRRKKNKETLAGKEEETSGENKK